jgi:glutamyl-tRNA synthetase
MIKEPVVKGSGDTSPNQAASQMQIRSRLAPTPSGFLHLGNGVNFLHIWLLVRQAGGVLKLRIDDLDGDRCRPEYIEDIFRQLDWLGLDWDEGPSGPDDFSRYHSQRLRMERYREVLEGLRQRARLFACTCSRKEIQRRSPDGLYPGTCRHLTHRSGASHTLRIRVEPDAVLEVASQTIDLCRELGDFVVWRRDDRPAYQLASLVDDLDDRINLIVRGEDLRISTGAQLYLAAKLGRDELARTSFIHHPLLFGPDGRKLSKSDDALSLAALRVRGETPRPVYRAVARQLAINPAEIASLADLLAALPGC